MSIKEDLSVIALTKVYKLKIPQSLNLDQFQLIKKNR